MAVPKSRITRSRRGKRRSQQGVKGLSFGEDSTTGELHQKHHVTNNGYYRGKALLKRVSDLSE